MHVESLTIHNFQLIGDAHIPLNNQGLVLLQGDNRDDPSALSNGAGKSTVVNALVWGLFSKQPKGQRASDVLRRGQKEAFVKIVLKDRNEPDHYWTILRERKKPGGISVTFTQHNADGTNLDLTQGRADITQMRINEVLGCNYHVFMASIVSAQEAMVDLPGSGDKDLKLLVERASGLRALDFALKEAREDRKKAVAAVAVANRALNDARTHQSHMDELVRDIEAKSTAWEANQKTVVIKLAEEGVEKAKVDLARIEKTCDERLPDARAAKTQLTLLNERINKIEVERAEQQALQEEARNKYTDANSRLIRQRTREEALLERAKKDKAKLENIDSRVGTPCGECGKPLGEEDLADAREAQLAGLRGLAGDVKKLREALAPLVVEVDSLRDDWERAKAITLPTAIELITERDALSLPINEYQEALREKDYAEKLLEKARERLSEAQTAVNPHDPTLNKKMAKEAAQRVTEATKAADEANREEALCQCLVDLLSPAGARARILDTITPALTESTQNYLAQLSDGSLSAEWQTLFTREDGTYGEKFNIAVRHESGIDSYFQLSGGEKRKVRLACYLALQDLVAGRAEKPIELSVCDEIDDALDAAGLERLMTLLEARARERGTLLIISHNDLKDWCRVVATVTKEEGVSTVDWPRVDG